ncbi:MAG: T9SS type A sorting domain-containing protein [Candidatus Cloacimonetes bacterium]|nr:T9SS type A sorting domain-containing protein [Candidatus Cloacimonadota bacterium]
MHKYWLVVLFIMLYMSSKAAVLHVPENYSSINDALNILVDGDTILVQPGTYVETLTIENKYFTLASLYLTTQDTSYVSSTIIDGGENDCVLRVYDTPDTCLITGFTITGGRQSGIYPDNQGGGIFCYYASLTLTHLVIENNYAVGGDYSYCNGGGIYSRHSNMQMSDVIIRNNHAPNGSGGGICSSYSTLFLSNMLITDNIAAHDQTNSQGGGIDISTGSYLNISNSVFRNNSADYGGGIYISSGNELVMQNVILEYNTASQDGGAICCNSNSPQLSNLTLNNNTAAFGGGIMCYANSSPILDYVIIENNTALSGGGICCLTSSSPSLTHVLLAGNSSSHESSGGGGMFCWGSSFPYLANVTFSDNTAVDTGGAILCGHDANPVLINCLLWNDTPQEIACFPDHDPNSLTIAYSDLQFGQENILTCDNCTVNWLDGNIDTDPLLQDDFTLSELSPCRDAGIAWYEYNENLLIDLSTDEYCGSNPDMGAYEYWVEEQEESQLIKSGLAVTCFPNPFNPSTTVNYELLDDCQVKLIVYNIKGQKVAELLDEWQPAGKYFTRWNAAHQPSGIYFLRLSASEKYTTQKLLLLK